MWKNRTEHRIETNKVDPILRELSRQYEENFAKLMECEFGSEEHKRLLKIEEKLNKQHEARQDELGIFMEDPEPPMFGGKYRSRKEIMETLVEEL